MPRQWQSMHRLQALFGKKFKLLFTHLNSLEFPIKERAKGQTPAAISLAQIDARAEPLGLDSRPIRLVPSSTFLYTMFCF